MLHVQMQRYACVQPYMCYQQLKKEERTTKKNTKQTYIEGVATTPTAATTTTMTIIKC